MANTAPLCGLMSHEVGGTPRRWMVADPRAPADLAKGLVDEMVENMALVQ